MAVSKTPRKTMRDELALAIISGLLASETRFKFENTIKIAEQSYQLADAMIEIRLKYLTK